ncbi:MAG: hypothetical protein DMF06_15210 [Verrucomicrobia bacterium]|nr:MAG: hypothetical protein DMF06_15210 [Verrucomicrobiota bacterium]
MRGLATLDEAGTALQPDEDFVLGLPVRLVLAQRLRLPTVERDEFDEMVTIQLEKAMPYPMEEMTTGFELVSQTEEASVISAVAVHNATLSELAAPLLSAGLLPNRVTVYGAQRAATHAPGGTALLIYPEHEAIVCAIAEEGSLSFTRTLDAADPLQLQRDLPQLALSAELQGINTAFEKILLDESLYELRDTVQGIFGGAVELIAVEVPPADTGLNLLPESWRQQRAQLARRGEWRKRLIWAGGAYAALLVLFLGYLIVLKLESGRLGRKIERDAPRTDFVKATDAKWRALAPAIDPRYYPIEVLAHLSENLPSMEVRITKFDQSARQISVEGEANTAALAYEFADKVKKSPDLQMFQFDMGAPRILPNDHAQFRLEGKPR